MTYVKSQICIILRNNGDELRRIEVENFEKKKSDNNNNFERHQQKFLLMTKMKEFYDCF